MAANLKLAISTGIKFMDSDFIPKFENLMSPIMSEGIFNFGLTLKKPDPIHWAKLFIPE